MEYRLGLDLGTNSLGWWLYEIDGDKRPVRSLGGGVRIFSDGRNPKDKESLAVARRLGRGQRRRRDRYLRRRAKLLRALIEFGLLPREDATRRALVVHDPYRLRARALDAALTPYEIGRAIFHLNQRRGFQSNRKTNSKDKEGGVVKEGVKRLKALMEETKARTLGEFLWQRQDKGDWVRARKRPFTNDKGKEVERYDIYPERAMVREEFNAIWAAQAPHHPALMTDAAKEKIADIIFFQRNLKPVEVGNCTFNPEEKRLPWADPLSQRRRIFETANQLRIVTPGADTRELTRAERDAVANALLSNGKRTFVQLRKLLKLAPDQVFNLESEKRTELKGDETAARLSKDEYFDKAWREFPLERQREIVSQLLEEEDERKLVPWLMENCGIDQKRAENIADAGLPEGYGSLGETATKKILAELERDVVVYSEAANRAGYHHSDFRDGEIHDALPYYGEKVPGSVMGATGDPKDDEAKRHGRVANPTVHIGLGQVRRVVNAIIERHGHPAQIVIELARELKANKEQRDRTERNHTASKKQADIHRQILADLGQPDTGENRLRLRLYDELKPLEHCCPYSGAPISLRALFSSEVEIDHILPFSLTLDNSVNNRLLVSRDSNRGKGQQTPHQAFGHLPTWPDIVARAAKLPSEKTWRFQPDAMAQYLRKHADFLDRHLTDTQHLSRMAREYLTAICDPNQVYAVPGGLTALLRGRWFRDKNVKDRNDHRHHARDAAVIGLIDRWLLQKIARASAEAENQDALKKVWLPMPWDSWKPEVEAQLRDIVVSHKPEHGDRPKPGQPMGTVGQFFKDTAYGIVGDPDKRGVPLVAHRVPLESLKSAKDLEKIYNPELKAALEDATRDTEGADFKKALLAFREKDGPFKGLRRVRIAERLSVITVKDKNGKPYKGYASEGNFSFTIWRLPDGKWESEIVTLYDAARGQAESEIRKKYPTAKKMMTLKQRDLIALEKDGERKIMRVVKFTVIGQITLVEHYEAGNLDQRSKDEDDPLTFWGPGASALQKAKARKLRVDAGGRLFDPGPLE